MAEGPVYVPPAPRGSRYWILDLGPEGGEAGSEIVAEGPPEVVAQVAASYTGKYLREARAL